MEVYRGGVIPAPCPLHPRASTSKNPLTYLIDNIAKSHNNQINNLGVHRLQIDSYIEKEEDCFFYAQKDEGLYLYIHSSAQYLKCIYLIVMKFGLNVKQECVKFRKRVEAKLQPSHRFPFPSHRC